MLKCNLKGLEYLKNSPDPYVDWIHYLRHHKEAPEPYKSWLEWRIHTSSPLRKFEYEPGAFEYTEEIIRQRKYTPDIVSTNGKVWFELKGRFRTKEEADKYLAIAKNYPFVHLVFVFQDSTVKMPGCKKRTMADWADMNCFHWTTEGTLEEWMLNVYPYL